MPALDQVRFPDKRAAHGDEIRKTVGQCMTLHDAGAYAENDARETGFFALFTHGKQGFFER